MSEAVMTEDMQVSLPKERVWKALQDWIM